MGTIQGTRRDCPLLHLLPGIAEVKTLHIVCEQDWNQPGRWPRGEWKLDFLSWGWGSAQLLRVFLPALPLPLNHSLCDPSTCPRCIWGAWGRRTQGQGGQILADSRYHLAIGGGASFGRGRLVGRCRVIETEIIELRGCWFLTGTCAAATEESQQPACVGSPVHRARLGLEIWGLWGRAGASLEGQSRVDRVPRGQAGSSPSSSSFC